MRRLVSFGSSFSVALTGAIVVACSGASPRSGFSQTGDGGIGFGTGNDGSGGMFGPGGGGGEAGPVSDAAGPVDVTAPCDTGLAIDDSNAASFAKAIGICKNAASDGFGLVSASYSNAFGSSAPPHPAQWGLLPKFGSVITPREGSTLGVLSSGYAREYDDPYNVSLGQLSDFVESGGGPLDGLNYPTGQAPPNYPKAAQGCMQDNTVNDMIDVKLVLKAPPDASGFQFDFDFYSSEWPNYVCSNFNDAFIAYLTSSGMTDNVSFDSSHNPVAVNIGFFNRCTPGAPVGCLRSNGNSPDPPLGTSMCPGGPSELGGTGYADALPTQCDSGNVAATLGGATGWLTTKAPINPGEQFTLEFMIWDAGDGLLDSSVLVDHFQWIGGAVSTGTTRTN